MTINRLVLVSILFAAPAQTGGAIFRPEAGVGLGPNTLPLRADAPDPASSDKRETVDCTLTAPTAWSCNALRGSTAHTSQTFDQTTPRLIASEIDSTAAIRAVIATGGSVTLPSGSYHISDNLILAPGQCLIGQGRTKTILNIGTDFNMSALGVVQFSTTQGTGACLRDIGIAFDQPDITTRASAVHYPPAIYAQNSPRFQIARIRVSGAWDGIDMRGNSGGAFIDDVEMGALNVGLNVLGSLDFVHLNHWHFWPFGMGSNTIGDVVEDGSTYSAKIGGTTSLIATGYSVFSGRTAAVADGGVGNYMTLTGVQLDTGSTIEVLDAASHVQVTGVYYTGSAASSFPAFLVTAGQLQVDNLDIFTGLSADVISVAGGIAQFTGGRIYDNNPAESAAHVTGGLLMLDGISMGPAGVANHTAPFVRQTGASGALHMSNTHWESTSTITATAVSIATDNQDNFITNNDIKNLFYSFPVGANLGTYGPNKLPTPIGFTPTITFATAAGTFAPIFSTQSGYYWYDQAGVRFQIDLAFTSKAYSGASGRVYISGFPFPKTRSTIPLTQVAVSAFAGLVLLPGYSTLAARYLPGTGFELLQSGGALPSVALGPGALPATGRVELHMGGFIPL
jgi:hypothetical protein